MSVQNSNSSNQSTGGGSCLLAALIMISICLALLLGAAGGAMLGEPRAQIQTTIYPKRSDDIPAPAPEQLHIVPSVQTVADSVNDPCANADPLADYAGWENGVGGQYPPCWASWTLARQNAFLRSH